MNTHNYEFKIGTTTFTGEIELSNAGVVSFNETSENKMSKRIEGGFKAALSEISKLYGNYQDFEKFEVIKNP